MKSIFPLVLAAAFLLGCEPSPTTSSEVNNPLPSPQMAMDSPSNNEPMPEATNPSEPTRENIESSTVETGSATDVSLVEQPVQTVPTRPRRRMNIDQLSAAMRQVSGGIGWTEIRGQNEVDLFEQLSSTLGKPDFAQATEEDLDPSTVFQKFLDDAARVVCTRMVARDLNIFEAESMDEPVEASPVLLVHANPDDTLETNPDAIDANLIAALQRFHGRVYEDRNDPGLSNWRWLFKSGYFVTGEAHQAWLGICLALFTHPDFYTY